MSRIKGLRGLTRNQESRPAESIRDTRALIYLVYDLASSRWGSIFLIILCLFCLTFLPLVTDIFLLLMLVIFWNAFFYTPKLPFRLPRGVNYPDLSNSTIREKKYIKPSGIYFFGNEVVTNKELWFSDEDMRTHALILGSTGSGKTQTLLSLSFNALVQGSGFIYVDGKGDNSLYAQIYSMAKYMGREDDLLVINYMTGAEDIIGPQKDKISNTLNPFAIGSSSMLSQLVVSMMSSSSAGSGDGDMWKGRAISFVEALMRLLVYLRDQGYLLLEANLIRRYFVLDAVEDLLYSDKVMVDNGETVQLSEKLPVDVVDPMHNYLATLPGYQKKNVGKQSDKTYEQHGYITMQLTRIFGSLADVYAHIMRTNLADVDFSDVVLNRRILVVLLPALEKSPDELSNLGKLIIASLKAMLAAGLGSKVQGTYKDVIEAKPSNSDTPFLCILDEYGYYAVEGFAVVPAQARSLGFSVVFAGQDIPAFQKASKEEAASIFANTNIKLCMKLEDPTETWDFFNKTAGEAYVSTVRSYNMGQDGKSFGYQDSKEAGIEKRARIDLMDLKDQLPGEAHVFFKSNIVRMKSFYTAVKKTKTIGLNHLLKVEPLSHAFIKAMQLNQKNSVSPSAKQRNYNFTSRLLQSWVDQEQSDKVLAKKDKRQTKQNPQSAEEHSISNSANLMSDKSDSGNSLGVLFSSIMFDDYANSDYFDIGCTTMNQQLVNQDSLISLLHKYGIMKNINKHDRENDISNKMNRLKKLSEHYLKNFEPESLQSAMEAYQQLSDEGEHDGNS
ncbi:type IV secretory system conjugative DNA transfer family protein [Fangia hongkongensis]|uniref:type IV secretory system conjugative DNA transfer family protein n=1 Tax=Fangia hongkongensis TaxID=270495 RepID=UPI00037D0472|nr:TraM recognition domain-containing protein [Fangia hongkongensis]MBK2124235.1 type IV secretion system DNA-binding domain-containing protein [Fangia hongkongensis]